MRKQAERSSVFVLVTHLEGAYIGALYEVKLDGQGNEGAGTHGIQPVVQTVSRFTAKELGRGMWKFCILGAKIYILPDGGPDFFDNNVSSPKGDGRILDIKTGKLVSSIKPPAPKWFGTHVSAYGKIYSLSDPYCSSDVPEPSFEEYDPINNSWKTLCSYPYPDEYGATEIQGYAVCDEIILFSICGHKDKDGALWAYNVSENKWCPVEVRNTDCCFRRRAVVVDQTIYAISNLDMAVVTFSIKINQNEEGHISYSIRSFLKFDFPHGIDWRSDQHLVSLGNLVFYLVQSGFNGEVDGCQPLSITKFQIVEGSKINFISSMHCEVDIGDSAPFHIQLCFTAEWEDVTLRDEEIATSINREKQVSEQHQAFPDAYQAEIAPQLGYEVCSSSQPPELSEVAEQFQQVSILQEEAHSEAIQHGAVSSKVKIGKRCTLKANQFCAVLPDKCLHQYDVTITPEVTSCCVNRAVMFQLVKLCRDSHLSNRLPAYDGRNVLHTAGPLPLQSKEFKITPLNDDEGHGLPPFKPKRRRRKFRVVIKFAAHAYLHNLILLLQGRIANAPQKALHIVLSVLNGTTSFAASRCEIVIHEFEAG